MQKSIAIIYCFLCLSGFLHGQKQLKSSSDIRQALHKLNVLGSVLYVAAHPDDENTRLISYLANERHIETGYLSLTRGDGGQNLIGQELDAYLGAIRTHELLAARTIDGGKQFFSRANDFGYSKNAEETFRIWNKDLVMQDLKEVLQSFQPDIIVNRFDHRRSGRTHGHHTASAMLSLEACQVLDSSTASIHLPKRIFFNTSWFFFGSRQNFEKADKSNLYSMDVGSYYPLKGKSNTELAAESRSMHKSQGFGSISSRGSMLEYFEFIGGQNSTDKSDIFAGIDVSWNRINASPIIPQKINQCIKEFNDEKPWLAIPQLLEIKSLITALPSSIWKNRKLQEINDIVLACIGFYGEISTDKQIFSISEPCLVQISCINRSPADVTIKQIKIKNTSFDTSLLHALVPNTELYFTKSFNINQNIQYTSPYWLTGERKNGYYAFDDKLPHVLPTQERPIQLEVHLEIGKELFTYFSDLKYKFEDPVKGEIKQAVDILPSILIQAEKKVSKFVDEQIKFIDITIAAQQANTNGTIDVHAPEGWNIEPKHIAYAFKNSGEQKTIKLEVKATKKSKEGNIWFSNSTDSILYQMQKIRYDHIPWLNVLYPATIAVEYINCSINNKRIAYIEGAGDQIDECMADIGFNIQTIKAKELNSINKRQYDVIIFGIRAMNTIEELLHVKQNLHEFLEEGGTVIMQYNTTADLITTDFAPSALTISRDRVTDEFAKVKFTNPKHPLLQYPNQITEQDFDNWVQERGLYYPNPYDSTYQTCISFNDPGEKELHGSLLYKEVGNGVFIYTPLAFFRQLPAGVTGAYRLFANLIAAGNDRRTKP